MSGMSGFETVTDGERIEMAVQALAPGDHAAHPAHGPFGRRYYPAALGATWKDASFAVIRGTQPVAVSICGSGEGPISYYGMPMRIWFDATLGAKAFRAVLATSIEHLSSFEGNAGASCIIDDGPPGSTVSPLGRSLHAAGAVPQMKLYAGVDLGAPEEAIAANLRKSYRSLINWGKRNIILIYVNADNPDSALFAEYQHFHHHVAGRITRSQESWDIMFDAIANGGGELSLGRDDGGNLVSATLVIDGETVSQYASAVYDRDRFDKPIGHWPVFDAILRAKSRGQRFFDLGEVPATGTASDKEVSIGVFKRGFTDRLDCRLVWNLPLNLEQRA